MRPWLGLMSQCVVIRAIPAGTVYFVPTHVESQRWTFNSRLCIKFANTGLILTVGKTAIEYLNHSDIGWTEMRSLSDVHTRRQSKLRCDSLQHSWLLGEAIFSIMHDAVKVIRLIKMINHGSQGESVEVTLGTCNESNQLNNCYRKDFF